MALGVPFHNDHPRVIRPKEEARLRGTGLRSTPRKIKDFGNRRGEFRGVPRLPQNWQLNGWVPFSASQAIDKKWDPITCSHPEGDRKINNRTWGGSYGELLRPFSGLRR